MKLATFIKSLNSSTLFPNLRPKTFDSEEKPVATLVTVTPLKVFTSVYHECLDEESFILSVSYSRVGS